MNPLNADAVKHAAQTRLLGQVVRYWASVDSTNAALVRLLAEVAREGTVVMADAQTAGRGRIGKSWVSPPGVNLHCSVLLKPQIALSEARLYTLIGSLAIADAVESHGVKAQVKWPNDVLVNDKKIGGILTEVQTQDGRVSALIMGIGVNLNMSGQGGRIMFMTEVLGRCSLLEQRVADIYSQFAGSLNDDRALASYWLGMAEEEKHHGKILAAEKAALEVDSDTGYFMPEFSAKLMEMDAMLKRVEEQARIGVTKDEAYLL